MGVDVHGFLINKKFYDKVTDKFEEDFVKGINAFSEEYGIFVSPFFYECVGDEILYGGKTLCGIIEDLKLSRVVDEDIRYLLPLQEFKEIFNEYLNTPDNVTEDNQYTINGIKRALEEYDCSEEMLLIMYT